MNEKININLNFRVVLQKFEKEMFEVQTVSINLLQETIAKQREMK